MTTSISIRGALALALATALLGGCEKRTRTRNSSGSDDLFAESVAKRTNIYRFVGVEQSLTDARKAVQEERWDEALAATDALLKQQPANTEAKQINVQARLEIPNQTRFAELNKAAAANEVAAVMRHYRALADESIYKVKAQPVFDQLKEPFLENQLADARALVRAGRCDDARRIARVTGEWFPDARPRLEDASTGCRPARGADRDPTPQAEVARNDKSDEKEAAAPTIAPTPAPALAAVATSAEVARPTTGGDSAPAETRTLAASLPAASAQMAPRPAVDEPPPSVPSAKPAAPARNIPMTDLEALRISGDKSPSLPAGAKMIARRDGVKRITMALKLCVSDRGVPTSVSYVKSSDYADANERVMAEIRKWRFRPYLSAGQAVPVCTATLLHYEILK